MDKVKLRCEDSGRCLLLDIPTAPVNPTPDEDWAWYSEVQDQLRCAGAAEGITFWSAICGNGEHWSSEM